MIIAIIPARGGSKRLPRKNTLPLNGKPLLGHVVDTCKKSDLFDRVLVTSEDKEILNVAQDCGACALSRPAELSDDHIPINSVLFHTLQEIRLTSESDVFCVVYSTAALLKPKTLINAYSYLQSDTDYVMGVSEFNYSPAQALVTDKNGYLKYQFPEFIGMRSQLYPHSLVSNGTFCFGRSTSFMQEKTLYGKRLKGYSVNDEEVSDIDYLDDYENLRARYEYQCNQ